MRLTAGCTTALLLATLVAAGPGAPRAEAHAAYKDSDPRNRATVSSPPSSVWAEFTEPVQNGARLDVFDPCGVRVDQGDATASAYRVTVSMSADKAGTYRVAFRVVSSLDGHPTSGAFTFTASSGAPCESDEGAEPTEAARSGGQEDDPGAAEGGDPPAGVEEVAAEPSTERAPATRTRTRQEDTRAQDQPPSELVAAQEGSPAAPAEDIPLDWLLVGFGLAAAIGAVGGQVYASIIGPGRRRRR